MGTINEVKMKPYGVISDTHNHNWNAFSHVGEDLVNNRLKMILDDTERCAREVAAAGGDTVYHGGDLFHVRGSIEPSVLNPTRDRYQAIREQYGVKFRLLPGNHDLEHRHSNRVGNAVEAMRSDWVEVDHEAQVYHEHNVLMVPWIERVEDLKAALLMQRDNLLIAGHGDPSNFDLIIHAPIDGVIAGLPDHGLTGEWLADLGFKRVFSGHYHNHKEIVPDKVWSIGALTHQTWGDVGSKAGFLVVTENEVKWHSTNAPEFVDIEAGMDPVEVQLRCDGNYVRVKVVDAKPSEVSAIRDALMKAGALGVQVNVVKSASTTRATASSVKAGASVEVSVTSYIKGGSFEHADLVAQEAIKVLAEAL
ncbi:metallophosphoesterase [Burkholderia cepacia]|uniref:metallophosphoesterase n=1 Tax=Burkholderia cepacia TaxID=292 RepID=UPI0015776052|nr:metallophosphoesterase family protein [Burkholderia cepacia]